ncbi:FAD-binding oxidoreductase [Candidatus Saccharibacteria bacterium]|nr:FAD-binding oxidoreductase [Candidatus Saccharibacteria bacterium]
MNKVAHYLQEHLSGEVLTSQDARRHLSCDASILTVTPSIVIYPRSESDVRKATRFTWQLAERGKVIPITARGSGTDLTGAALGEGIMLVFPAHMNKILELDPKTGGVAVQPGVNFGKLQQTLYTHGRFLPSYPASLDYSTIGGAIANNASGDKSVKYGATRNYVRSLRVVLANGEVIETRRISKRELGKKLGLGTMEGDIYRAIDGLIEENKDLIEGSVKDVSKNSAGYAIADVKHKDGSFDLTPLIVGSQGTLAIVTEAVVDTEPHVPSTSLMIAEFDTIESASEAVLKLRASSPSPSVLEMVDQNLLNFIDENNTNQLKGAVDKPFSKVMLFIEFDDAKHQKKAVKKAGKIIDSLGGKYAVETDMDQQDNFWKIRESVSTLTSYSKGETRHLPIIEDAIVPVEQLPAFVNGIYETFESLKLDVAIWGHIGDGNLHVMPLLNVGQVGDRQKIFKLMKTYFSMVISLGGSITGQHGDGRVKAPFLVEQYGQDVYALFEQVKSAFDPHGILNPGVKIGVTENDIKPLFRKDYSLAHLYDYLPRL